MTPSRAIASASLLLLGTEYPPPTLDLATLRRAYQRMALLAHPDTRRSEMAPDFHRVRGAYEVLTRFLQGARAHRAAPARERGEWRWSGKIPTRVLRLGEFLFYEGTITWSVLIRGIAEQRGSRPNLGTLACAAGYVTRDQVSHALRYRRAGELVGDVLVRLRLLGAAERAALLKEQSALQRPLGWHLVRMGVIPRAEIPQVLIRYWRHNGAAMAASRARPLR